MQRLDQYIRFMVQGKSYVMSLNTRTPNNEWVIRPEEPDATDTERLNRMAQLFGSETIVRIENDTLILDAGFAAYHVISDGIALRPMWEGKTLEGLLGATACLIAYSLALVASTLGIRHFRRSDGRKIQYLEFINWWYFDLMRPVFLIMLTSKTALSERDLAYIRLYDYLGIRSTSFSSDEERYAHQFHGWFGEYDYSDEGDEFEEDFDDDAYPEDSFMDDEFEEDEFEYVSDLGKVVD